MLTLTAMSDIPVGTVDDSTDKQEPFEGKYAEATLEDFDPDSLTLELEVRGK